MSENEVSKKKHTGLKMFLAGLVAGALVAVMFTVILYYDYGIDKLRKNSNSGTKIKTEISSEKEKDTAKDIDSDESVVSDSAIEKLQTLEKVIDKYFYLERVEDETLREGMYKGLMSALGDPYTEYYTAEEYNDLMDQTEGIYYGIGAYVGLDSELQMPRINSVIRNSPAEDAELRANDLIYKINGESTYGMTLTEAVSLIKGPEGTEVVITFVRDGVSEPFDITLIRRKVEAPTITYSMEEDKMALIQITEFDDVTVSQFEEALNNAKSDGAKGLILDLRGNPGGSLSAVVKMCKMILPEGLIVYTEDKNGLRRTFECDGSNELTIPLVVLVDQNSASAAEIMSGAIKDYGLGTLVGVTTFGKGIVQQIVPFKDGSAVKITISAYYTPSGKNIHGIGIEPDVECEFDSEAYYGSDDRPDNQLEKAKEVLREKMNR